MGPSRRPRHAFRHGVGLLLGAALVSLFVSCGGGGGGEGGDTQRVTLLIHDDWRDGQVRSTDSDCWNGTTCVPRTGDDTAVLFGQYYSFRLSPLPSGAEVVSAQLRLYQARTVGSPFAKLGEIWVDHVHFTNLNELYYSGHALEERVGLLTAEASGGYKTVDVTANLLADLALGHAYSAYRVRFYDEVAGFLDGVEDYVNFTDREDSCCGVGFPPQLVVTYRP
jgi:hypothetical protein